MYWMPTLHFLWYLNGLSEKSGWVQANQKNKSAARHSRHSKRR